MRRLRQRRRHLPPLPRPPEGMMFSSWGGIMPIRDREKSAQWTMSRDNVPLWRDDPLYNAAKRRVRA